LPHNCTISSLKPCFQIHAGFSDLIKPGSRDERLLAQIDLARLPRHIAIIMDGNGRWAQRRHMPRVAGHRAGVEAVRATVETSARLGIEVLTLYPFQSKTGSARRLRSKP